MLNDVKDLSVERHGSWSDPSKFEILAGDFGCRMKMGLLQLEEFE